MVDLAGFIGIRYPPIVRLDSPILAILAFLCAGLTLWIFRRRPLALPQPAMICAGAGLALLILACGDLHLLMRVPARILVMIDESPSTRGASYRDEPALKDRLNTLLGGATYEVQRFGQGTDRTIFPPPRAADAIVLFSDGQFDLPPVSPAIYPVIDPALEQAGDVQVRSLEFRGRRLAAVVKNSDSPRVVTFSSDLRAPQEAPRGETTLLESVAGNYLPVVVRVQGEDRWPENDALTIQPPQPFDLEKWWVGDNPPDESWRTMAALPADAGEYLRASVIALDNQPASPLPQHRIEQYVRDLGGSLLILGGESAFAMGDYPGTTLEDLSPLASLPPRTRTRWVLLCDQSGSMAGTVGNTSRAQLAMEAMISVLANLPPEDLVDLGIFARDLSWLSSGKSAEETLRDFRAPALNPTGPTNLEPVLRQIDAGGASTHLLVLSDGQASFEQPDRLIESLKTRRIRPFILLVGDQTPDDALSRIVRETDGQIVRQLDPAQWSAALRRLTQAALPPASIEEELPIRYANQLQGAPPRSVRGANRVWLKSDAVLLAESAIDDRSIPLAGQWQVGEGQVAALAYRASAAEISILLKHLTRPPRDPRIRVEVTPGPTLRIEVDAHSQTEYLNGLSISAQLSNAVPLTIPQSGPGRYELALAPPREPALLTIRVNGAAVERIPLAGRYPPEFDEIGVNRAKLQSLTHRSGGKIIESSAHNRLDIARRKYRSVASWCAALAALLLGTAMVLLKNVGDPQSFRAQRGISARQQS